MGSEEPRRCAEAHDVVSCQAYHAEDTEPYPETSPSLMERRKHTVSLRVAIDVDCSEPNAEGVEVRGEKQTPTSSTSANPTPTPTASSTTTPTASEALKQLHPLPTARDPRNSTPGVSASRPETQVPRTRPSKTARWPVQISCGTSPARLLANLPSPSGFLSLGEAAAASAQRRAAAWGTDGLAFTPQAVLQSARRALFASSMWRDGEHKVWLALQLRIGLESLVASLGNGRINWLRVVIRNEFARLLEVDASQVEVLNIREALPDAAARADDGEGPARALTSLELLVAPPAEYEAARASGASAEMLAKLLQSAGEGMLAQVERNRLKVADASELLALIVHMDAHQQPKIAPYKPLHIAVAVLLAFVGLHLAQAFGSVPSMLRVSPSTSAGVTVRGSGATLNAAASSHVGLRRSQTPDAPLRGGGLGGVSRGRCGGGGGESWSSMRAISQ
jgi:hypothetical protein